MKLFFAAIATVIVTLNTVPADEAGNTARQIILSCDKSNLAFDQTEITVAAGESIQLLFINPEGSTQPHNVVFVQPGKALRVGMLVNRKMSDPEFIKDPNPRTDDVMFASKLLQPGEKELVKFTAPTEVGDYPYICTYPGHWAVMKGVLRVVEKSNGSL